MCPVLDARDQCTLPRVVWCSVLAFAVGSQASIRTRPARAFANGAPSANTRTHRVAGMGASRCRKMSKHGQPGILI